MKHIFNTARFNQTLNYSNFPMFATDIDGVTHIKDRLWVWLEAKTEGTDINRGQLILAKQLVEQLGAFQPSFFVIAHHNTKADEDITGDNLLVSTVIFKAPHVKNVVVYDYELSERPSYRKFLSILSLVTDTTNKLKDNHVPDCDFGGLFDKYHDLRKPTITALTNDEMMREIAELDSWDDLTDEHTAFMFACGYLDDMEFYEKAFTTWVDFNDPAADHSICPPFRIPHQLSGNYDGFANSTKDGTFFHNPNGNQIQ